MTKYVILGAILTKINRDNDDVNDIYRAKQAAAGTPGSYVSRLF